MIGILTRKLLRKSGLSSRGAHPKYVRPRTLLRLAVSETALLGGGQHPLHQEIAALAHAVASPEHLHLLFVSFVFLGNLCAFFNTGLLHFLHM